MTAPTGDFWVSWEAAQGRGSDSARRFLRDHWPSTADLSVFTRLSAGWNFLASPRPLRVAIAGTGHRAEIAQAVRWYLDLLGIPCETLVCSAGVLVPELLAPQSELRKFAPDFLWIFSHHRDFASGARPFPEGEGAAWDRISAAWKVARSELGCEVIQNTLEPLASVAPDFPGTARALNVRMREASPPGVRLFDLAAVAEEWGHLRWTEDRLWFSMGVAIHPAALPILAMKAASYLAEILGKQRKCLILDLDNTLWGGEAVDLEPRELAVGPGSTEGLAFAAFQERLAHLRRHGLLLAVCSKNQPERVREVFRQRQDMPLRYEDFSCVEASFDSDKAEMIKRIAARLGLRPEAFFFIDDNPVEREWVRRQLPEVSVPHWPENPEDYSSWLGQFGLFPTGPVTAEDQSRTRHYQLEEAREEARGTYESIGDYLGSLEMRARLLPIGESEIPRATQLLGRTNQFNLTGEAWTESRLRQWMAGPKNFALAATLDDRFGPYGIVSVLLGTCVADELRLEQWVVSCRVFSRGFEESLLGASWRYLAEPIRVSLRYRPSGKNHRVAELLPALGFSALSEPEIFGGALRGVASEIDRIRWDWS